MLLACDTGPEGWLCKISVGLGRLGSMGVCHHSSMHEAYELLRLNLAEASFHGVDLPFNEDIGLRVAGWKWYV